MEITRLLDKLASPARRAIEALGVRTVEELARHTEEEIGGLHGIGPKALRTIAEELAQVRRASRPQGAKTGASPGADAVDAYIAAFPPAIRRRLEAMRRTIRAEAPGADEKIGYGIPTFVLGGNLVHFAGYRGHVGFYPGAAGVERFERELAPYRHARGSVQFPHGQPLPLELVRRIVRFRVAQNRGRLSGTERREQGPRRASRSTPRAGAARVGRARANRGGHERKRRGA